MTDRLPRLTRARADLTRSVEVINEHGQVLTIAIPAERALTVYVDKRELVTLMTLGAQPELLVLGFLRNQRLAESVQQIESIAVDWEVGAAAVKTRGGIADLKQKTAKRVVTTGCGQGSVFGELMGDVDSIVLPPATLGQQQLYGIVNTIRLADSTYKIAGSVHGCALFRGEELLMHVEDVGRHNAIDTIAGWMWLQDDIAPTLATGCAALPPEGAFGPEGGSSARKAGMRGDDKVFYTTGRLTSEMVIKSAQMGVPIVISRSGITQMGLEVAQRLGLCAVGRATNRRFFSSAARSSAACCFSSACRKRSSARTCPSLRSSSA